ncbi:MAG: class I SAM-dependent methyltransferase [Mariprofundaceae bacterium]|nr:class I SAM-dependent methyltransferase [Mariprofundaceae bacterium]
MSDDAFAPDMTAQTRENIQRYVTETIKFSKVLNLTSVKDEQVFQQHFIDPSLALCQWLPSQGVLLDVGSGMGVPGVPILLAQRGLHGVLVERRKKRAEFLRHIARMLALNADIYDCDVRALKNVQANACVARAVTRPEALLRMIAPHMVRSAVAVLPTASATRPVSVSGWHFESLEIIAFGRAKQHVQRYRCTEGFT